LKRAGFEDFLNRWEQFGKMGNDAAV